MRGRFRHGSLQQMRAAATALSPEVNELPGGVTRGKRVQCGNSLDIPPRKKVVERRRRGWGQSEGELPHQNLQRSLAGYCARRCRKSNNKATLAGKARSTPTRPKTLANWFIPASVASGHPAPTAAPEHHTKRTRKLVSIWSKIRGA
jgi:hypothetical protein